MNLGRRFGTVLAVLIAGAFTAVPAIGPAGRVVAAPTPLSPPSRLVPVGPMRVADTRLAECGCVRLDDTTIRVIVAGRAGVPAGITAAAITVTATEASTGTFVTVWPSGTPRPETSTVNLGAGRTAANSTIVPLGAAGTPGAGAIDVFSPAQLDLIIDVTVGFVPAATSRAGRFVPTAPRRLLDTRETGGVLANGGAVDVALPAGVAADSLALVLNVTSVDATSPGFVTGRAAGTPASTSSFVNPDGSGAPRAASIIVPASPAGVTIESSSGGHLIVDLVGWFTGPSAAESGEGMFVAATPTRLLDTRIDAPRLWRGGTRELASPISDAAALVTNVTLDQVDAPGFVAAFPAGNARPATSSINAAARNTTIANLAITTVSTRGLAWFANVGTDLIVDLTGWFTGAGVAAPQPPSANAPPTLRTLLIGDSTLAALDVVTVSQRALQGFEPVLDAAPCRRLVGPSCRSAYTGQVPNTAVQAIAATPGPVDVVVIKAGYNEGSAAFEAAAVEVLLTARERGVALVLWLTYSEGTRSQLRTYEVNNATLLRLSASGDYPELEVADWRTYAAASTGWHAADRVHLQGAGAWATADYISRWVAHATHRPCPQPWVPGGPVGDPCPSPDLIAISLGPPDLRGLYGF